MIHFTLRNKTSEIITKAHTDHGQRMFKIWMLVWNVKPEMEFEFGTVNLPFVETMLKTPINSDGHFPYNNQSLKITK